MEEHEQAEQLFRELERANGLIELGRFDEGVSILHRLLAQDPENDSAWCLLAQAQLGRQDYEASLEAADRAVAIDPEWEGAHRLRCVSLIGLGKHSDAVAAAYAAIKLAPEAWHVHVCLALALGGIASGKDGAIRAAENAVRLAPDESETHLTLGNALADAERLEEAAAAFRRALAIEPDNSAALNNLARIQVPRGRFSFGGLARAATGFRTAVQADPHSTDSSYNIDLTLRIFLARLSYLIFIVAFIYYWLHFGFIVVLLAAPVIYGVHFASQIGTALRRHLFDTITHGLVGAAAATQLLAIGMLLYVVFGTHGHRSPAAGLAFGLAGVARLLLMKDMGRITGKKPFSDSLLRRLAFVAGVVSLLLGAGAAGEPSAAKSAFYALASAAAFAGMIYAIRELRRN